MTKKIGEKVSFTILDENELFNVYKEDFRVISALSNLYTIRVSIDPNVKIIGKIDDKGNLSTHITYQTGDMRMEIKPSITLPKGFKIDRTKK
jgi:hypothetical protein